jgi:glycosyltransferase involved in cell wall biosynthesis
MKILHLIAGAGPMYCGSCLHGNTLAAGLRKAGADVVLAPLYTPVRTDEENVSIGHLSLGGINVYLDEILPWWRGMPGFLRGLMDRPWLVSWAAKHGGGTRPEQLGRLTVAMFRGDDGPLKDDVEQLLAWLESDLRPDIVHLSNVMLAGLARPLKERLGAKVVATLTGEDGFLEKLPRPYYEQARAELRARSADLDAIIALSRDYADFMADYLGVPPEKIEVMRPGLNLEGFPSAGIAERGARSKEAEERHGERVIGFLSRICPEKGLHLLLDALHAIRQNPNSPPFRLRAAGYLDRVDRRYLHDINKQAAADGLSDRFEYVGELDRAGKIAFLQSLDVFCLPSQLRESKGLPVLEAWACGVPAVLPDYGVFREFVNDAGGGILYSPRQPGALESALARVLNDDGLAVEFGRKGMQAVQERYSSERESREVLALYARLVPGKDSNH